MGHSHAVEKYLIEATLVFPWLWKILSLHPEDAMIWHVCISAQAVSFPLNTPPSAFTYCEFPLCL